MGVLERLWTGRQRQGSRNGTVRLACLGQDGVGGGGGLSEGAGEGSACEGAVGYSFLNLVT